MKGTIDIDIGGTFTDCYLTYGERVVIKKTPTTSYNLSVGFMKVIEESCQEPGPSLKGCVERYLSYKVFYYHSHE